MIQRCLNPNNPKFARYGGRGITVCERWRLFREFLNDMGERPAGTTIDRIDVHGNYEPSNCRWANATQQARNTTRNRFVEVAGEIVCVSELSEKTEINARTIRSRLRAGYAIDKVLDPRNLQHIAVVGESRFTGEKRLYKSIGSTSVDGFQPSLVRACLSGRQQQHHGWVWRELLQED
jgi:hypothetical protein